MQLHTPVCCSAYIVSQDSKIQFALKYCLFSSLNLMLHNYLSILSTKLYFILFTREEVNSHSDYRLCDLILWDFFSS